MKNSLKRNLFLITNYLCTSIRGFKFKKTFYVLFFFIGLFYSCSSFLDKFTGTWQGKEKDQITISLVEKNSYTVKYSKPSGSSTSFTATLKNDTLVTNDIKISCTKKSGKKILILDGFLNIQETQKVNSTDSYTTNSFIVCNKSEFEKK